MGVETWNLYLQSHSCLQTCWSSAVGNCFTIQVSSRSYLNYRVRIGMTVSEAAQAARIRLVSVGMIDRYGHYLTFTPTGKTDRNYRLIFETDGRQVANYRVGKMPEVTYVEGCS